MNSTYTETFSVKIERDVHSDQKISENWYDEQGRLHRSNDLPAAISYDPVTQKPQQVEYYFHGMRHRIDGPAFELRAPNSNVIIHEQWRKFDKLHREDGAAVIRRNKNTGEVTSTENFIDNRPIPKNSQKPKPF